MLFGEAEPTDSLCEGAVCLNMALEMANVAFHLLHLVFSFFSLLPFNHDLNFLHSFELLLLG